MIREVRQSQMSLFTQKEKYPTEKKLRWIKELEADR